MAPFEAEATPDDAVAPMADPAAASMTGVAEVDEVLASLEQLDALPVGEHVAVFEQAHDTLRRVLDGART